MRSPIEADILELYAAHARVLHRGSRMEAAVGNVRIALVVLTDDRLTDCESDILRIVTAAGRKLRRKDIVAALEAEGILWGESTIANALAALVARQVLVNRRDKRGYGLQRAQCAA